MENHEYDSAFDSVEEYVLYVKQVIQAFMEEELSPYFRETLIDSAIEHVYIPYKPIEYKRKWTLSNRNMYGSVVTENGDESSIYVYSKSPHARIVVNGYPYDHPFLFNGVPRPFGDEADKVVVNELNSTINSLEKYLNENYIDTK